MSSRITPKPQCGTTRNGEGEYDLVLHTAGLFMVLAASCIGAGFPVAAKRLRWMKVPPKVFFACKHFGTGVLIATAFVHLIPTAFESLNNPCLPDLFTTKFTPLPGVVMMGSMFILFIIEIYLNSMTGGHSHGGATGEGITAKSGSYGEPAHRRIPSDSDLSVTECGSDSKNEHDKEANSSIHESQTITEVEEFDIEAGVIDEQTYTKMAASITLLEGGILFHSVFVGMTVSITTNGFVVLLIAIIFHQLFEGLGLGSRIAAVPWKQQWRPWVLVFAFGTTAPIGQAIGLATRSTWDPNSALGLILVGIFNAISSGLLIYAALVDLLAEDFLGGDMNARQKIWAFILVILGAIGMSIIGAFA